MRFRVTLGSGHGSSGSLLLPRLSGGRAPLLPRQMVASVLVPLSSTVLSVAVGMVDVTADLLSLVAIWFGLSGLYRLHECVLRPFLSLPLPPLSLSRPPLSNYLSLPPSLSTL